MDYRIAVEKDKPELFALWQEAFGDGEEDIQLCFDTVFTRENTVVAVSDGRTVSALYLIEAEIVHEGIAYKAYYVYAAATLMGFRRQGIMSGLLDYACALAKERGFCYLFLHPASEELYGYYEKCGFETAFFKKPASLDEYSFDSNFSYVRWGMEAVELEARQSPDTVFFGENGYASYYLEMGTAFVNCFYSEAPEKLFSELSRELTGLTVCGYFPSDRNEKLAVRTGMLRKTNGTAPDIRSAYLGITLE